VNKNTAVFLMWLEGENVEAVRLDKLEARSELRKEIFFTKESNVGAWTTMKKSR
jgi:hypothetical protein